MKRFLIGITALFLATGAAYAASRLTEADEGVISSAAKVVAYYRLCEPQPIFSWQSSMPQKVQGLINKLTTLYGTAISDTSVAVEVQVRNRQAQWCADNKPFIEALNKKL